MIATPGRVLPTAIDWAAAITTGAIAKAKATMIDYNEIDPGIRHVVKALNDAGHETSDSGDGSKASLMDCAIDFPHVAGWWDVMFANREALENTAHAVALAASEADGKPWKCDVGYDSLSKQWTWITYPLDGDSQA